MFPLHLVTLCQTYQWTSISQSLFQFSKATNNITICQALTAEYIYIIGVGGGEGSSCVLFLLIFFFQLAALRSLSSTHCEQLHKTLGLFLNYKWCEDCLLLPVCMVLPRACGEGAWPCGKGGGGGKEQWWCRSSLLLTWAEKWEAAVCARAGQKGKAGQDSPTKCT